MADPWITDERTALATDLYQLTMMQAYWRGGMDEEATFDLFVRTLPDQRNFLVAAGLDDALQYLETVRFSEDDLDFLASRAEFEGAFLDYLRDFRFTGTVRAMPEGTPLLAQEPILEVTAPIIQAQLVETYLLNQITFQTVLATKAARVVGAAERRDVVDFGMRRMHGTDAAMKGARAMYIAGLAGTSNVRAGMIYGIPLAGTMAHSYIEAHDSEEVALRAFAETFPGTTLLVDTYDTLAGVRLAARLAKDGITIGAVRLDSGDLARLAHESRAILDEAGLHSVRIIASGGLDEYSVRELVASGAPIDAFGVGTRMGTSSDAPTVDSVYKLSAYAGEGRMKLSEGKETLPGRKQVFREIIDGVARQDVIGLIDDDLPGEPLLATVMQEGKRTPAGNVSLDEARAHARLAMAQLPERIRALERADEGYPVEISPRLAAEREAVRKRVGK
jgi:nicotinate phosphoribosyltransferase